MQPSIRSKPCRADSSTLPPALAGERLTFQGLSCYVAGQGPPLLLLHSVNATASAAEVRPLYERCRERHTVFALDLPGFGFSDRSARPYTPRLMADALHATTAQMRRRCGPGPVDAPACFNRLALVSPSGLSGTTPRRGPPGATRELPLLHALLTAPGWGPGLFRQLTRPALVRRFLEGASGSRQIDEAMWDYALRNARQPGAWRAPLQFLAGRLFSADIHTVYESIPHPVWLSHGVQGDFADFRALPTLPRLAAWRHTVFLTGALPYAERLRAFMGLLEDFLERAPPMAAVAGVGCQAGA